MQPKPKRQHKPANFYRVSGLLPLYGFMVVVSYVVQTRGLVMLVVKRPVWVDSGHTGVSKRIH